MNQQPYEEMDGVSYVEKVQSFCALFGCTTFLTSPCIHQPKSCLNFILLGSNGGFII